MSSHHRNIPDDYVALGQHVCIVCTKVHNSGEVLINKNLRSIPKDKRITDYGLCPECKKLHEDGYVALVAVSNQAKGDRLRPENAQRTGEVAHIRRTVFRQLFNMPADNGPIMFTDSEVIKMLQDRTRAPDVDKAEVPTDAPADGAAEV